MKVVDSKSKPVETVAPVSTPTKPQAVSDPEELLATLKAKHRLFTQLENEGLIHKDHQAMGIKLSQTIQDLEALIRDCHL